MTRIGCVLVTFPGYELHRWFTPGGKPLRGPRSSRSPDVLFLVPYFGDADVFLLFLFIVLRVASSPRKISERQYFGHDARRKYRGMGSGIARSSWFLFNLVQNLKMEILDYLGA